MTKPLANGFFVATHSWPVTVIKLDNSNYFTVIAGERI